MRPKMYHKKAKVNVDRFALRYTVPHLGKMILSDTSTLGEIKANYQSASPSCSARENCDGKSKPQASKLPMSQQRDNLREFKKKPEVGPMTLIEAGNSLLALIQTAQKVLAAHVASGGISEREAINQLLGLLDGPQWRTTFATRRL